MNSYVYRDGSGSRYGAGGAPAPRVLAFVDDAKTARTLAAVFRERGHEPPEILEGGLGAALESSALGNDLDILIVDVDSTLLPIADIGAIRTFLPDHVRIVALGSAEDLDYGRQLVSAGASNYVVKPVSPERIGTLVFGKRTRAPVRPEPKLEPAPKQRVTERQIVVLGARGGVGATSIAINLAAVIAGRTRQPSLLVDLDLQFGTALLSLNLHPTEALGQMLRDPARIDDVLLRHSVQNSGKYLDVLGAEEPLEPLPEPESAAMPVLMNEIGAVYRNVVMDVPAHRLELLAPSLSEATHVVLVGDLSLAGVRDTLRMLGQVQHHAPAGIAAHVVIGGVTDIRHASMTQRQFEESVGQRLTAILPHEPAIYSAAAAAGRPVIAVKPGSKSAKACQRLSDVFLPEAKRQGRGLFRFRTAQTPAAA